VPESCVEPQLIHDGAFPLSSAKPLLSSWRGLALRSRSCRQRSVYSMAAVTGDRPALGVAPARLGVEPDGAGRCNGTVALRHPCARQDIITRMLRWSDGGCEVVEGDAQPVVFGNVGGDVVVAAAQVLHEGVTGGEGPR
jgi:hypothetical protein